MRSSGDLIVESAQTSLHAAFGSTVPYDECASRLIVSQVSSTYSSPFTPSVTIGSPSHVTPPPSHRHASADSSSRCSVTNSSIYGEPISSSPSMQNLIEHGSSPRTFLHARIAATRAAMFPLLSLTPRPYSFPSRSVG